MKIKKKIKNLIFIFETFLTKYDFEKYGFEFYKSKGIEIKILNISPITRVDYFNGEKEKNHYIKDFQKNCFSLEDLKMEISKYRNTLTASIIHINNLEYYYETIKMIRHNNILTIKHFFGGQPFKKKNIIEIFSLLFSDFSGGIEKIKSASKLIKLKFFKKEKPDIVFYVGSKLKPKKK